jgi:alpha-glucosidase
MLADNPTRYYQDDDCTQFITSVPTTWDETRVLEAKVGQYAIVAKRKGHRWYIGGICNGEQEERTFNLSFDFLGEGRHRMTVFRDGLNANYQAMHYNKVEYSVARNSIVEVRMAKNGGWAAVIE